MKLRLFAVAIAVAALVATYSFSLAGDKAPGKDVKCPVSGKPIDSSKFVEYNGGKVYFCCPGCPGPFKENTAKYATKANRQLVQTEQMVQVKCPLTGKDTNPATAIDVGGVKVAFCCNNCKGKVAKAEGDEQLDLVFGDAPLKKGFKIAEKK